MEKLIYVNVVKIVDGSSELEAFMRSRNIWYVIRQRSDRSEIEPVFEDLNHLNHTGPALLDTACKVIGSRIYVVGGVEITARFCDSGRARIRDIRFIDTHNPEQGWMNCFTLPFTFDKYDGTVAVHDQWLYFWVYRDPRDSKTPWGYAVNFGDSKEDDEERKREVREISPPCDPSSPVCPPVFAGTLSPGKLAAYMETDGTLYELDCVNNSGTLSPGKLAAYMEAEAVGTLYELDCVNNSWSMYQKLPYTRLALRVVEIFDGLLYIYHPLRGLLTCFDIANKEERYVADDLPQSSVCDFIVLSKDRFCIIEHGTNCPPNHVCIYYTRFSISLDMPKPSVIIEEYSYFHVPGRLFGNAVAVDPHPDLVKSWSFNNSGVDMANHPKEKDRVEMAIGDKPV